MQALGQRWVNVVYYKKLRWSNVGQRRLRRGQYTASKTTLAPRRHWSALSGSISNTCITPPYIKYYKCRDSYVSFVRLLNCYYKIKWHYNIINVLYFSNVKKLLRYNIVLMLQKLEFTDTLVSVFVVKGEIV